MYLKEKLGKIIRENVFNEKWRCNLCGKEIFSDKYFCDECYKELPFNDGIICSHCGRKVIAPEEYCSTCKNYAVNVDKARSVFVYGDNIRKLILGFKYDNKRYLAKIFSEHLANLYFKHYMSADFITFVPTDKRSLRKRGYNQSELLAKGLSENIGVPIYDVLEKKVKTKRQAELTREERLKNLKDAFLIKDKKAVNGKTVLIVDDVTTTGATSEAIAEKLKKAGAKSVLLLTVASVPPKSGY